MRELKIGTKTLRLERADITTLTVDAIVNAANDQLLPGGGVCGAIHRAGGPDIARECRAMGSTPTGQAAITTGGRLPARHVIHAVGPIWQGGGRGEDALLASAYRSSLRIAEERCFASVAFPSISTGIYGFPIERAASIALRTVADHLIHADAPREVTFALFSDHDLRVYEAALAELAQDDVVVTDEDRPTASDRGQGSSTHHGADARQGVS